MSTQYLSHSHRALTFSLLALAAGVAIWTMIGTVSDLPDRFDLFASNGTHCRDTADVIASLDRSRNGVSLTCNSEMLLGRTTE